MMTMKAKGTGLASNQAVLMPAAMLPMAHGAPQSRVVGRRCRRRECFGRLRPRMLSIRVNLLLRTAKGLIMVVPQPHLLGELLTGGYFDASRRGAA